MPKNFSTLSAELREKETQGSVKIPMPYTSDKPSHFSYNAAAAGSSRSDVEHAVGGGRSVEILEPLKQS